MPSCPIDQLPPYGFARLPAVMAATGLARSTIYDAIKAKRFPAPEKLTAHASGWRVQHILDWLADPGAWTPGANPALGGDRGHG